MSLGQPSRNLFGRHSALTIATAKNGRGLASCRISIVLDLEGAVRPTRTTAHSERGPRSDPQDVPRELAVRNWSNQGRSSVGLLAQPSSVPIYRSTLESNQQATCTRPGAAEQIDLTNRADAQERSLEAWRRVFLDVSRLCQDKVYKIRSLHRSWSSASSPGIRRYQNRINKHKLSMKSVWAAKNGQAFACAMPAICSPLELNSTIGRVGTSASSAST